MTFAELLSSLLQPILDLIPRIAPRPKTTEWCLVDRWLGCVKMTDNPVVFIPTVTHVEYYPLLAHPIDVGLQSLTTADGISVCVNATVIILINDPCLLRSVVDYDSWEELVSMRVRWIVTNVVTGHNWSMTRDTGDDICFEEVEEDLLEIGIDLKRLVFEDLTVARPIRLLVPSVASDNPLF